ncbi:TPA: hypothetical protein I7730_00775 [Vibrio vulnificus]|uniref:Uncharacterized protein n=1 Tax=Vibrio vulnificus TaxID=672 RepID=A0A8H9MYB3_VIBVL|nr:hypothetical protein [Vibrio vulnificus]HAS8538333.1 hypothetical protein [Vibrio vulnificus]
MMKHHAFDENQNILTFDEPIDFVKWMAEQESGGHYDRTLRIDYFSNDEMSISTVLLQQSFKDEGPTFETMIHIVTDRTEVSQSRYILRYKDIDEARTSHEILVNSTFVVTTDKTVERSTVENLTVINDKEALEEIEALAGEFNFLLRGQTIYKFSQ